jgi:hypothetical protein
MTGYYGMAAQQQVNPYYGGGAISGYGLSEDGVYAPSYATSGQDSWAPQAGASYGRAEATGYY